jgi:hypothetical protein
MLCLISSTLIREELTAYQFQSKPAQSLNDLKRNADRAGVACAGGWKERLITLWFPKLAERLGIEFRIEAPFPKML